MKIELIYADGTNITQELSGEVERIQLANSKISETMQIKFAVPIRDMHCVWTPNSRTPEQKLHWKIDNICAAQSNFPYLCFMRKDQLNTCSVGSSNLIDDTQILAQMNQESGCYNVTITIALSSSTPDFYLTIDRRAIKWTEVLSDWRDNLGITKPKFPRSAWKPVFCTWYAVHAALTQKWVEDTAELAAGLGFGTLIIDDGWCFDTMKRVSPETIGSWYEMIGDWEVSTAKFPDFAAHVERVKAMGLKYMVWVAPLLVGNKSRLFRQIPDALSSEYIEGAHTFDTSFVAEGEMLIKKIAGLVAQYDLDGLKIDFLDYARPGLKKPSGRTAGNFIRNLSTAIRQEKADALIEFRQSYATPGMMPYATQFRAGDVPFDFIDNFNRLAQIRLSIGDKIPIHADPVFWHPDELPENIARHLIAALVGVPMLSMELSTLSPVEQNIIRHYLKFYQMHLELFSMGAWQVEYNLSNIAWVSVENSQKKIIFLNDAVRLDQAIAAANSNQEIYLLNLSEAALEIPGVKTWNVEGKKSPPDHIVCGGGAKINPNFKKL